MVKKIDWGELPPNLVTTYAPLDHVTAGAHMTDRPTCEFDGPDADGFTWFRNDGADGGFELINLGKVDQQALHEAMAMRLASVETDDPPAERFVVPGTIGNGKAG